MEVQVALLNMTPIPVNFFAKVLRCFAPPLLQGHPVLLELLGGHRLQLLVHLAQECLYALFQMGGLALALHDDPDARFATPGEVPLGCRDDVAELLAGAQNVEGGLGEDVGEERGADSYARLGGLPDVDVV